MYSCNTSAKSLMLSWARLIRALDIASSRIEVICSITRDAEVVGCVCGRSQWITYPSRAELQVARGHPGGAVARCLSQAAQGRSQGAAARRVLPVCGRV